MILEIREVKSLALKLLAKKGYSDKESVAILNSLLWAELRGSTQGLIKLFGWRSEKREDAKDPIIEKQEENLILINANFNSHIVACDFATESILTFIEENSVFVAGIKGTDNSAGALGYFTERLAKAGYIAIMMSAADPGVVAYGGKTRVFGTNPISISVPTTGNPLLLDMSTAALTWGDLVKYDIESKSLPEGLAFDKNGKPTTNPREAMDGSVTTFDKSYKSSGLALMIQILAGPLVGSVYSTDYKNFQYGSLIIVVNPKGFGDERLFLSRVESMVKEIKESETREGYTEVLLPGERGYKNMQLLEKEKKIEISEELYSQLIS